MGKNEVLELEKEMWNAAQNRNADLAGKFHITTTWKKIGEEMKVVFNMDQREKMNEYC